MCYQLTVHKNEDGSWSAVFKKSIFTADEEYQRFKIECKVFNTYDECFRAFQEFVDNEELEIPFS